MNIKCMIKMFAAITIIGAAMLMPHRAEAKTPPQPLLWKDRDGVVWAYTVNTNGEAMSAYMMCAALWVACLAFCLMFSPFNTSANSLIEISFL